MGRLHHIHITTQVMSYMEAARVRPAAGRAQVSEVNEGRKLLGHRHQIIVFTHAIGAGAEGQAVGRARCSVQQSLRVCGGGQNTRQAQQRPGGSSGC